MEVINRLNKYKLGLELSREKLSLADPDADIIFLRKFNKSSGDILELVNEALLILKEGNDGK